MKFRVTEGMLGSAAISMSVIRALSDTDMIEEGAWIRYAMYEIATFAAMEGFPEVASMIMEAIYHYAYYTGRGDIQPLTTEDLIAGAEVLAQALEEILSGSE